MKIRSNTVAIVGTLLMAGSLALAGDFQEISQNDGANHGGGSRGLLATAGSDDGGTVDVDRKYPLGGPGNRTDICGDMGEDEKCRPRPRGNREQSLTFVRSRYLSVCMPFPVGGRQFCWGGSLVSP